MFNTKFLRTLNTVATTLTQWKNEILNYFNTGLTNDKTEGFNTLAKTLQRRALAALRRSLLLTAVS